MAEPLHEPLESLTPEIVEMHRALVSLIEELEAVDWYSQRIGASGDEALRKVLVHNRDEEKEHAAMTLEWIRRNDPVFDAYLREHLFRPEAEIAEEPAHEHAPPPRDPTLRIGSLRLGGRRS